MRDSRKNRCPLRIHTQSGLWRSSRSSGRANSNRGHGGRHGDHWGGLQDIYFGMGSGRRLSGTQHSAPEDPFVNRNMPYSALKWYAKQFIRDYAPEHSSQWLIGEEGPAYHLWSIGIVSGASPTELGYPQSILNPVLTREHVTDVRAVCR